MSNMPLDSLTNSFEEARFWLDQGIAYFESSKFLAKSLSNNKFMPIITLQSFSVECFLKSLLLLSLGKYPEKHDSVVLFERLPDLLKTDLSNQFFAEYAFHLMDALEPTKFDFVRSRYHFEDFKTSYVGKTFSIGYLETLAVFFIEYIKINGDGIYSNWNSVTRNSCVTSEQLL